MPAVKPPKAKVKRFIDAVKKLPPEFRTNMNRMGTGLGVDHATVRTYFNHAKFYKIPLPSFAVIDVEVNKDLTRLSERERQRYIDQVKTLRAQLASAHRELNDLEDARKALFNLVSEPVHVPHWSLPESRPSRDSELPMLFASDWQYGETITQDRLGVGNAFNPTVANERVKSMVAKAIELSFVHRGRKKYPGIYYLRGGDMISGEIHDDLRESNAMQSGTSARALVALESWVIRELVKAFGRVHVISVPGNHGRTTLKPRSKWDVTDNFDVLTHYWLEDVFRAENAKVTFDAPASGDALFTVYGYNFCMTHGDKIGSSGGQGFLGAVATILRGMKKTFDYYATLGTILDYILVGHFHTSVQLEYGFANGGLPGLSEFAKGFRMRPQAPQQWLLYVHPDFGVCDSKAIVLGPRPRISEMAGTAFEKEAA